MTNYQKMVEGKKEKSLQKVDMVKNIISLMKKNNECINFYTVSKKANCSRSFLYNHHELRDIISLNSQESKVKDIKTDNQLKLRIRFLEKQIEELTKDGKEDLRKTIERQRAQIEKFKEQQRRDRETIDKLTLRLFESQNYE